MHPPPFVIAVCSFSLRLIRLGSIGVLATCLFAELTPASAKDGDPLDSVQQAAIQWTELRNETARLRSEWTTQKEMLESTLTAERQHLQVLQEKHDALFAKTKANRQELDDLAAKNSAQRQTLEAAEQKIKRLTENVQGLRRRLPPRLSDALDLPYRTLADGSTTGAQRAQQVFNILNRCSQFNKAITYGEETLSLPGNPKPKLVEVIYWGLSSGYALDQAAGQAFFGSPAGDEWKWTAAPEMTSALTRVIAMHRDKSDPDVVALPSQLLHVNAVLPSTP